MLEMKNYLIVVDMQKDFVDGILGTPEAKAIVEKVAEAESVMDIEGLVAEALAGIERIRVQA